jgi:hypothetical protein
LLFNNWSTTIDSEKKLPHFLCHVIIILGYLKFLSFHIVLFVQLFVAYLTRGFLITFIMLTVKIITLIGSLPTISTIESPLYIGLHQIKDYWNWVHYFFSSYFQRTLSLYAFSLQLC